MSLLYGKLMRAFSGLHMDGPDALDVSIQCIITCSAIRYLHRAYMPFHDVHCAVCTGAVYHSPSAWALAMVRLKAPTRAAQEGWRVSGLALLA